MVGPLEGYRVVELAEGVAGPTAGMQLADAGAEVVKIEPLAGERSRGWVPSTGDASVTFQALNRSKRGIALDLASEEGVAIGEALCARADVVIADVNRLPHMALGAEAVGASNPQAVYLAISGFGPEGPWSDLPAGELGAQLASEATASLGTIGEAPVRAGNDIASTYAAIYGVQGVCAALLARDTIGSGQRVDVSLFGSLLAMRSTLWVALSNPDEWWGFHLDSYVKPPDHGYQCADHAIYFSLARMRPEAMDALLADLGMQWVADEPNVELLRGDTAGGTGRYAHVVHDLWERGFGNRPAAEVMAIIERHGGIAFPMNDYPMLVGHPQVQHAGVVVGDGGEDNFQTVAPPWKFSDTPLGPVRPAPALGEHSRAILSELGHDGESIGALVRAGVVGETIC